ncbi:hypothetical protein ACFOY2_52895 [Nonomuraea purpurea]|uniref:Integrase n=1 Tax=Nonomuraea purpurea TaxID=1849276 RepID=A0ABV8GSP2_9ACTN
MNDTPIASMAGAATRDRRERRHLKRHDDETRVDLHNSMMPNWTDKHK